MTPDTRLAPAHPRLVARTERLGDLDRLTDSFGIDGTAWLDGACGFVTAGIAAIVEPRDAVAALRAIDHVYVDARDHDTPHDDTTPAIGPRAVGALPFEGGGRMIIPACIVARDASGRVWRTTIAQSGDGMNCPIAPATAAWSSRARTVSARFWRTTGASGAGSEAAATDSLTSMPESRTGGWSDDTITMSESRTGTVSVEISAAFGIASVDGRAGSNVRVSGSDARAFGPDGRTWGSGARTSGSSKTS